MPVARAHFLLDRLQHAPLSLEEREDLLDGFKKAYRCLLHGKRTGMHCSILLTRLFKLRERDLLLLVRDQNHFYQYKIFSESKVGSLFNGLSPEDVETTLALLEELNMQVKETPANYSYFLLKEERRICKKLEALIQG